MQIYFCRLKKSVVKDKINNCTITQQEVDHIEEAEIAEGEDAQNDLEQPGAESFLRHLNESDLHTPIRRRSKKSQQYDIPIKNLSQVGRRVIAI